MSDKSLARLFHDLFHNAARLMHRSHKTQGKGHMRVHRAQGLVLNILKERGDTSQRDLMEILDIRSSSLSELLTKLEQQGYITRIRDENDKRGFIISITPEGAAVVEDFKKMREEQEDALFRSLSEEERAQLAAIITKLINSWKEETDSNDNFMHGHMKRIHGKIHKHIFERIHRHWHDSDHCENNREDGRENDNSDNHGHRRRNS